MLTDINIYVASTTYHLLLACADCCKNDLLICAGSFKVSGDIQKLIEVAFGNRYYCVKPLYYYKENYIRLLSFRNEMKRCRKWIWKEYQSAIDTIIAYNDVDPVIQWILSHVEHNRVRIVEEGIGLYRDSVVRSHKYLGVFGKLIFGSKFENITRMGTYSTVDTIACYNPELLNEAQKLKKVELLQCYDYKSLSNQLGIEKIQERTLFIGQPLVEDGVLSREEYLSIIRKMISIVECGHEKWVIKPHPRETIDKYNLIDPVGIRVIGNNELPVELMIDSKENKRVFTLYSSAVISLSCMSNVECYCLCGLLPKAVIPSEIKELFQHRHVLLLSSWNDLKQLGEEMIQESND